VALKRLIFGVVAGALTLVAPGSAAADVYRTANAAHEANAQASPPRVIIRPRRLGPNAKRYCRTHLVQEYRVSGTVIVPHTTCWWR